MKPITAGAVEYLCRNMRELDAREIYNLQDHDNPFRLARDVVLAATYGKAAIAEHGGKPAAIIGVSPLRAGIWSAWAFGTRDWSRCAIELTRYAANELRPFVIARAHRLQCESRVDHHDAHRWLQRLGARPDGLMRGYGRDGSDYIMFSWSRDDVFSTEASRAEAGTAAA